MATSLDPGMTARATSVSNNNGEGSPVTDREALIALFKAANGAFWVKEKGWCTSADLRDWHGVTVNDQGRVVELHLQRNNLQGSIPRELGNLSQLTTLLLSGNILVGVLPPEFGRLSELKILEADGNELEGSIPRELGNLRQLTLLLLSGNNLTGVLPQEFGRLRHLRVLDVGRNMLDGSIPRELGDLGQLTSLLLSGNNLAGVLPRELGRLSQLKVLDVSRNTLEGSIPKELGDLDQLTSLLLNGNSLTGVLPQAFGRLSCLKVLDVGRNRLEGSIPAAVGKLETLTVIDLNYNRLEEVPLEFLKAMEKRSTLTVELGANPFRRPPKDITTMGVAEAITWWEDVHCSGSVATDREALIALFKAASGHAWTSARFWCSSADLKDWHGVTVNEAGRVVRLELLNNSMYGPLPKELGDLGALRELLLINNHLSGSIPRELGNLSHLTRLMLGHNKLTGPIPKELGNLRRLSVLFLGRNVLTEIPLELLQALRTRHIDLASLGLADNPISRPPQTVLALGFDQAIAWWKDIERFGEGTSNKLKMVLVGLAEAGKTTVVRNITGRPVPKKSDRTVGIEITTGWKPVEGGPLEISVWDFAGQADYFASHQIFLTKGSLFLLVVDLRALFVEATSGAEDGDPNGRVYRWLEMLHIRVPGAAVALVGTHTDAAEFEDLAKLEEAVDRLERLIARYNEDKAKEIENVEAKHEHSPESQEEHDTMDREVPFDHQFSSVRAAKPPIIHQHVFRTSANPDSTKELVKWIAKAATLMDCPPGFHFPAVRAKVPKAWIDANSAMDALKDGEAGKRYVTWCEAVATFDYFMKNKGTPISDAEDILLRAMRHREAEGGVLLSLEDDLANTGKSTGMLYLDPTWLIELIRRLTDHNLVDAANQGTLKSELEVYGREHDPRLELDMLWTHHRSYRTSGTLGLAYLRFLWLHRRLDANKVRLSLNVDEFNSVLTTMEKLMVLFKAPTKVSTDPVLYVVPARLPEYGDEQVLEKGDMALGDVVVRTRCSFRRSYAPPGIIGRFLASSNAHIKQARECWQHGAHLIWTPGAHDVLVYEAQSVELSGTTSVAYPALVLCVKGNTPEVRQVLDSLTEEVKRVLEDKAHGYPGLCSVVFEDPEVLRVSDLTSDLRQYLDNRFEQLGATIKKVAKVTSEVLQACYLSAEKENEYPRLLILKPETMAAMKPPLAGSSRTFGESGRGGGKRPAAAEGMRRETWNKWIHAFTEGRQVRMVFICEHDMTEVECGPDGKGYLIKDLSNWARGCLPLLQASLSALRLAVGMVSHVDLPLDDLLAAVVKSASIEVVEAMRKNIPVESPQFNVPLPNKSRGDAQQHPPERLQRQSYAALCKFMQSVERPSKSLLRLRSKCPGCGSTQKQRCVCVSWKSKMVRVSNGKGGLVWVKTTNEAEYKAKIAVEGGN